MANTSDDIILAILVRLPVKSLVRFRSVSKPWGSLISGSNFVKRHCSRENEGINTLSSLRILYSTNPLRYIECERLLSHDKGESPVASIVLPLDFPIKPRVVGSCNGLICLQGCPAHFFLWNPSTRDINELPILENFMDVEEETACMFYGFGYDSTNQDYKIIYGATSTVSSSITKPDIFTLKSGSWMTSNIENWNFVNLSGQGCLSNGALHWLENIYDQERASCINLEARIIVFDLHKEKFQEVARLSDININAQFISYVAIRTSGDSIYLTYHKFLSSNIFTVSKMREYKVEQSWDLDIIWERENKLFLPKVMYMLEKGGVLMRFLVTLRHKDLVLYDPADKTSRTIFEITDGWLCSVESLATFKETLISPITRVCVDK